MLILGQLILTTTHPVSREHYYRRYITRQQRQKRYHGVRFRIQAVCLVLNDQEILEDAKWCLSEIEIAMILRST